MRAGFRALLENIDDVQVVGEAGDGQTALQLCAQLRPDIFFVDIDMPRLNGLEVAQRVQKEFPQTRVIILSMHTDALHVQQAMKIGVSGYLPKSADLPELEMAIIAALRHQIYISPSVSDHAFAIHMIDAATDNELDKLTPRQREVLQLIAEGHSTKEIANILSLSIKTIETHRAHMMDRLQIFDVAGLVKFAIRTGLITAND